MLLTILLILSGLAIIFIGANQTIAANKIQETIMITHKEIRAQYEEILTTNGADMSAGLFCTSEDETYPDVVKMADGLVPKGIILDYANVRDYKAGYSLGHTFPDGKRISILRKGAKNVTVQVVLQRDISSSLAVAVDDPAYVIDGATWDLKKLSVLTLGAVTNKAPGTIPQRDRLYVGRFAQVHAVGSADNLVSTVVLD